MYITLKLYASPQCLLLLFLLSLLSLETVHTDCDRSILTRSCIERSPTWRPHSPGSTSCPDQAQPRCRQHPALHPHSKTHWFDATWIARAIVERTLPSSSVSRPAIVHPPGAAVSYETRKALTRDAVLQLSGVESSVESHAACTLDGCCQRCLAVKWRCDNGGQMGTLPDRVMMTVCGPRHKCTGADWTPHAAGQAEEQLRVVGLALSPWSQAGSDRQNKE